MPRLPLVRPDAFFAERVPLSLAAALGVVLLVALVTTTATGILGWMFAEQVTGTITVENEHRPPDWVCEDRSTETAFEGPCSEPKQREVSASELAWRAFEERLPFAFAAPFVAWPILAVALHLASSGLGGENGFGQTLAVAAWGMLPSVFRAALVVVGGYFVLQGMSLSSDPQVLVEQVRSLRDASRGLPLLLVALVEAAWQGAVWAFGLKHAREMDVGSAGIAAGVVAAGSVVLALL